MHVLSLLVFALPLVATVHAQGSLKRSFWSIAYSSNGSSSGFCSSTTTKSGEASAIDSTTFSTRLNSLCSPLLTGTQLPACGANQDAVTADMQLLAQLTPRIRLYGADCDQTGLVLQGIKDAGVALTAWLGIFIDGNETTFVRQLDLVTTAIQAHGTDHVSGITVGNEYLLMGGSLTVLETFIRRTNETIIALNLNKTIPISTSEAGAPITPALCASVDQVFGNAHCWFGSVPIDECAQWTTDYYKSFIVEVCDYGNGTTRKKSTVLSETGWPTGSDSPTFESNGASLASIQNLQIFLDTFICQANQNKTEYFFFEFRDELWKTVYGGVESHWGLFDVNSVLKEGLVIPDSLVSLPDGLSAVPKTPSTSATSATATATASSTESTSEPSTPAPTYGFWGIE